MKTTINFLMSGQLAEALKQVFDMYGSLVTKYHFQPVPSYWTMTPAGRLMNDQSKRN